MLRLGLAIAVLATLLSLLGGCLTPQQPQQAETGFDWTLVIFLVLIFAVFYFLMIRPQRNRQKQQRQMMGGLKRGDQVVAAGGIYGQIDGIDEETVLLKVESGVTIRVAKSSVIGLRPR